MKGKDYDNYIFDLYGTLIDIHVDEMKLSLWKLMAKAYNVYGCGWEAKALRESFFYLDKEERVLLQKSNGSDHPEIKLERVFVRLLLEAENTHDTEVKIEGKSINELREKYACDREGVMELLMQSDWCMFMANLFRIESRTYFRVYKNTIKTLNKLREKGKKIYLLSNAAGIFTRPELENSGLAECFDAVYISSDLGVMKPDIRFMNALIEGEKLDKNRSVMVGNEIRCDEAIAKKCGMDCILINSGDGGDNKKTIEDLI
ncbi:MAG: HAD family hydrolase [Lachnospiraceae bacterium]|nr:HAD family hydrolase [Lachnospiraceae bacterium]